MTCTFFGHRDAPKQIEPILRAALIDLIENKGVNLFYVGNNGCFDNMVKTNLKLLHADYPPIRYAVVLAIMPGKRAISCYEDASDTIYPEELEGVPPRYAISKRNRWMIDHADYVITYVNDPTGSAAQFKRLAERKGKTVIELTEAKLI